MRVLPILGLLWTLIATSACAEPAPSPPLVSCARQQIGVTTLYDPAYVRLSYPNGDVAAERGVCTDVLVRALRCATGQDLQQLLHQDMRRHFSAYPKTWGLSKPDPNIDHRRVGNLQTWLTRQGAKLHVSQNPQDYQAGDIVTSLLYGKLPHLMIVSDRRDAQGVPLVIHNIGAGTQEEARLFEFPLTGHYRLAR